MMIFQDGRYGRKLTPGVAALLACLLVCTLFPENAQSAELQIAFNEDEGTVSVKRDGEENAILTQNARPDFRPYLHPIVAPDGNGVLTEYSPGHHKHQTGLYWGFTRVNGRDYFHHPEGDYWRRTALAVLNERGPSVQWKTVYALLDASGDTVLSETQTWQMSVRDGGYLLDLTWQGTAHTDITIGEYAYGGLFLRMPWKSGVKGTVVNASGLVNHAAEGQRDVWVDVGMQVEGREDLAHIAIFDHQQNNGYPLSWRVDGQSGVGPVRARLGDWTIGKGKTETIRHRIVVYTGPNDPKRLDREWSNYTGLANRPDIAATSSVDTARQNETIRINLLVQTLASTEDAAIRAALMRGMLTGLEGRRNVPAPDGWAALSEKLSKSKDERVRELSSQLSQIFGDLAATRRALAIMSDASMNAGARRNALYTLLSQQNADASNLLETLLDEDELAIDAIRGYAIVENATAPAILLHRYKTLSPELRRVVVETLATRKSYAERLIEAVEQKIIQREEIPTHVARSLNSLAGQRFIDVFGEMRPVAEDREKLIAKYKAMLTPSAINSADASRGRAVFKKTCAACHTLYGDGGKIGPDLTGSNRANLDYILLNSVDPSYDVPAGYKMLSITTVAGRVVNGVLAEEDDARVVLKTVEQPRLVIVKTDIDDRVVSSKSMMPEGQLQAMKPQDVIDLIKYLRTTGQVEIAK